MMGRHWWAAQINSQLLIMKALTAIIAACAVALSAQAQELRWLQTSHDFGAFSEDLNEVETTFRFVNDTAEPVMIIQVASSCGCTVPSYDLDPVAPGDTAAIQVKYNAIGRPGRFNKSVYVRTTANHDRTRLTISGSVIGNTATISRRYPVDRGALKFEHGAAMVGKVKAKGLKSTFIDIYNQSADTLDLAFAEVPDFITTSMTPDRLAPGETTVLNIFFDASKIREWGIVSDSLMVSVIPDGPTFYLPVTGIIEEDFSKLTPRQLASAPQASIVGDRVDLGQVPIGAGGTVTATIEVQNQGKDPLIIRRAYSQDPALDVRVVKGVAKRGKKAKISVTFDPTVQPTGLINSRITIITNDPSQPTRSIRVVGERK